MNCNKMNKLKVIPILVFLFSLFMASGLTFAQPPEGYFFEQGKEALEHQDLLTAYYSFQDALSINPDHQGANLFYALTRVLMISKSTNFNKLLDRAGMSSYGRDIFNWTADFKRDPSGKILLPFTSPTGKDLQDFLRKDVLPQVDGALYNLSNLQGDVTGSGTVSSPNKLTDTTKSWVDDEWVGHEVLIGGTKYSITGNTANTIYVSPNWAISPGTYNYEIYGTTFKWIVENGLGVVNSPNILFDITKSWVLDEWKNYKLLIDGTEYTITGNTQNIIYVSPNWNTSPGPHIYEIFENVEIDYGDVLVLKGSLHLAKAGILVLNSYDLNIDIDAIVTLYNSAKLSIQNNIINAYKNLLNLLPDQKLPEAKEALSNAIDTFIEAINFITAEKDDQENDLFVIEPPDPLIPPCISEADRYRHLLADLRSSLSGPTFIRTRMTGDPPQCMDVGFDLNLSEFFDYPKNLRGYLPIFLGPYKDGFIFIKRDSFPDPTFGGILPNMTREELQSRLEEHIRDSYPITPLVLYDDFLGPTIDKNRWVEGEWVREIIKTGDYVYDNFSGAHVDNKKWKQGDFLREIQGGKAVLKQASSNPITVGSFPYGESNWLSFPDQNSVNSIQADVAVLESSITNSAKARARLGGTWYWAGPSGQGQTGDIWANVEIRRTSTELFARWSIDRCTNSNCSESDYSKKGDFSIPINFGQTYTLYIEYDSDHHRFVFRVNNEQIVFDDPTLPAKLGEAVNPQKGIGTRVEIEDATSSGYISATFDNVIAKDGSGLVVVSDNFSSPTINPNNWNTYEFAREIKGGKFRSKIRSSEESTSLIQSAIDFEIPTTINNFQAKITPIAYQNPEGVDEWAGIWAGAYNDGTGNATPGDRKGDVFGAVRIGGTAAKPTAMWQVFKIADAGGTSYQSVDSGNFITPVSSGATYTLFVGWDGAKFTFKFNNEPPVNYTPKTAVNPIKVPFKGLGTQIPQPINNEGAIEAQFDDVTIDVTNVVGGSDYKLLFEHASPNPSVAPDFPYTTYNQLGLTNPNTVNSIQADVFIVDNVIAGSAWTSARLDGRFYNDGTAGGGYAGDIYAEIAIGWTSKGLRGWWWVAKYTGNDISSQTRLPNGSGNFSTAITPGVTYPLYIGYDGANKFTFRIGSEQYTFNGPTRQRIAQKPSKSLTTRVQIDDPGSSGYISTTFDNVIARNQSGVVVMSDDFTSPTIDNTKWGAYESVREISGGKFRSKVRSSSATTASVSSRINLLYPSEISAIQTKVTPLTYQNADGARLRARIAGLFYNDGTPGGGAIGDVGAQVRIAGTGSNPIAEWNVFGVTDIAGKCSEVKASGVFNTPISVDGKTYYTLFLGWDGWQFTFKINNEVAYYVPETGVYPPNNLWKGIETQIYYDCTDTTTGKEATFEAQFDDVMVSGPLLSVSPASYNFGNLIARTKSLTQTFTLSNNGAKSIGIESIDLVGTDASMFNIVSTTCPGHSSTHPPKGKCNIVASFQPKSEGEKSAAIRFTLNTPLAGGGGNPAIFMPLKGTGLLETISTPTTLIGGPTDPTGGTTGTTYTFTTGGSSSNLTPPAQHPIQYLFDWDDGTNSGWLPVGKTIASKVWTTPGTYTVTALARCATHTPVVSDLSSGISVNITFPIHPSSPLYEHFSVDSLYPPKSPPTFGWTKDENFISYEIQISPDYKFKSIPVKVKVPTPTTSAAITATVWKTILLIPGKLGGVVYWRVVGTRSDKNIATSEITFIIVDSPQPVENLQISPTSKATLPMLSWKNNFNIKFKVWFGNDPDFTKPGMKKTALDFSVTNPSDNGGIFTKTLTSSQWIAVRKVVGDVSGPPIFWYVESWDVLGRYAKTEVLWFVLTQ